MSIQKTTWILGEKIKKKLNIISEISKKADKNATGQLKNTTVNLINIKLDLIKQNPLNNPHPENYIIRQIVHTLMYLP